MKYILRHILFCLVGAAGLGAMLMLGCQKENKPAKEPAQQAASAPAAAAQPMPQATAPLPVNAQAEAKAIAATVYGQVNAMNRHDMNGVLAVLNPNDRQTLELTRQELTKSFAAYRLQTTIEKARLASMTGDTATVEFTQLTRRISGPAFRDNRVIGVHALKKIGGMWRIISTRPLDIQFLDGKP